RHRMRHARGAPRVRGCRHAEQVFGQPAAHVRPRSEGPLHVALGRELLEGPDDRAAREAVLPAELARARQPHPGAQTPLEDGRAQVLVQPTRPDRPTGARRQHQIEGRRLSRHLEVVQRIESKWPSTQGPLFRSLKTRRSWMRTGPSVKPMSLPTDPANIPWIPLGPGESFKPLRFPPGDRGRVLLLRLEPGTLVPLHRHGGEVHGYNVSGSRKLLETGEIVGPGVYVYEPPGNVDSWMA